MNHWEIRQKIIDLCLLMNSSGLNQGTSGNISARYKDYMLITPSGIPYEQLSPGDLCRMSLGHDRYEWKGPYKPSSEWHFHRSILQRNQQFGAVVHTHSTYATVLSIGHESIPPCHYMIAAFGGNTVRCANYATFGTAALSNNVLAAMKDRSACLMANHGMLTAGADLDKAMWAAIELETLSKQYYLAKQANSLVLLSDEQMSDVHESFKSYGVNAQLEQNPNGVVMPQDGTVSSENVNEKADELIVSRASVKRPRINLPVKKNI